MSCAPVALFVYNRPWHTRQTVAALLANPESAQTPLYIFSDAPKNAAASKVVAEVRSYIRKIDGFESVTIIEREVNFGLARSIIDGVTQLCEEHGRVIVLEDDLEISPHFLAYMNAGLTRYENEEKVMQIAGYMFPVALDLQEDALLLPFTSSWGWATWKRAWQYFDASGSGYQRLVEDKGLRHAFDLNGNYGYFQMLESQLRGETDSWAIRWYLSVFLARGLVLYPKITLVRNLGFDGSGINCVASTYKGNQIEKDFLVVAMPHQIAASDHYVELLQKLPKPKLNVRAVLNRLRNTITAFYEKIN